MVVQAQAPSPPPSLPHLPPRTHCRALALALLRTFPLVCWLTSSTGLLNCPSSAREPRMKESKRSPRAGLSMKASRALVAVLVACRQGQAQ